MCFYGYFFFKDWHPVVKDKWQKLIAWIKIHLFSSPFFWLVLGWYCKCKSYICIYGEADIFIHGVYCISYFLICMKWSEVKSLSRVQLFVTPWTVAYQAPQGSTVHGVLQATILQWVAISFSSHWEPPPKRKSCKCTSEACSTLMKVTRLAIVEQRWQSVW